MHFSISHIYLQWHPARSGSLKQIIPMSRPSDPLDTVSFAGGSSLADIPGLTRSTCLQAVFGLSFAQKSNPLPIGLEGIWSWCLQADFHSQLHGNITATSTWSYKAERASEQHSTPVYNLPITNCNRFLLLPDKNADGGSYKT